MSYQQDSGQPGYGQHQPGYGQGYQPAYGQPGYSQDGGQAYAQPQPGSNPYGQAGYTAPQGYSVVPSDGAPEVAHEQEKFNYGEARYRDAGWTLVFLLHLVGIVVLAGRFGPAFTRDIQSGKVSSSNNKELVVFLIIAAAIGLLFSGVWLQVIKKCAATIIQINLGLMMAMMILSALICFATGMLVFALVYVVLIPLTALYYCAVRRRIPFTTAILVSSVKALETNSSVVVVNYLLAAFQILWVGLWAFVAAAVANQLHGKLFQGTNGLYSFFLLLSLYWTSEVLKNVCHVTTAGVVASWWLLPQVPAPTGSAFRRAITTSFGSICLGSLLVAVLKTLRAIMHAAKESAKDSKNLLACCAAACAECILGCIESMIVFFNVYAYTEVAIYGKDFVTAAKDTWAIFTQNGFDLLINADLTSMVIGFGCLTGGVITSLVVGLLAFVAYNQNSQLWIPAAAIAFVVGFLMTAVVMNAVESAVATTFVLWAEEPSGMMEGRAEYLTPILSAAKIIHPDRNWQV